MTGAVPDLLRARLARRWLVTVEVVTPAPDDEATRARILALADALRDDDRVAALTLTDRTTSPDADPIALAPLVADRSRKAPLVHLAGKGRTAQDIEHALDRCKAAGIGSVLLTGGDAPSAIDSVEMLHSAAARAPAITRVGIVSLPHSVRGIVSWERARAKREAGADAFIAQVTWDLAEREIVAEWQARLRAPIVGAVMLLSRTRLAFLTAHRITGIHVPPALRDRIADEPPEAARRRLALDLVALRRLGYAGAHLSGLLTPSLVTAVLDEADALHESLGDEWRAEVW